MAGGSGAVPPKSDQGQLPFLLWGKDPPPDTLKSKPRASSASPVPSNALAQEKLRPLTKATFGWNKQGSSRCNPRADAVRSHR